MDNVIIFPLFIVAIISNILLLFKVISIKKKTQMYYVFLAITFSTLLWSVGNILEVIFRYIYGYTFLIFVYVYLTGLCLLPVSLLFLGIVYTKTKINFTLKYIIISAIPAISMLVVITDPIHHLYIKHYSHLNTQFEYGPYVPIHSMISYLYIAGGIFLILKFSIKNTGYFSRQSMIIFIGSLIPVLVNIIFTFKIIELEAYVTPLSFLISIICYAFAILKYHFLSIIPIAIHQIIAKISDSYIVIDEDYKIIDYNKALEDTFGSLASFSIKDNFLYVVEKYSLFDKLTLENLINNVTTSQSPTKFDIHFEKEYMNKDFNIEIAPIQSNGLHFGTIILLKDITKIKENENTIEKQHKLIVEQERLASLGTLMGGISHNLKTPIMSISGCIMEIESLIDEYGNSIGNSLVTNEDHKEIAKDMTKATNDLKGHLEYISNALTAIKDQVVNHKEQEGITFTLKEVIESVQFLMTYELKKSRCFLSIQNDAGNDVEMNGDIGTLVQIINNLISNSIQAYDEDSDKYIDDNKNRKKIDLYFYKSKSKVIIKVTDYGKGIPEKVKKQLFKDMVTTKGKFGNGIGLYLSYSKVKVVFKGEMWFESEEGQETSFYIKIPKIS